MDKQAFPLNLEPQYYECFDGCSKKDYRRLISGMTMREYAAVAAMQGVSLEEYTRFGLDACINFAVQKADALLARLEEKQ